MESLFCCPVCGGALNMEGKRLFCMEGHSFDKAKQGYVNLLTGKGGGTHGDNREMLEARRDFLESGAYEPLKNALVKEVSKVHPEILLDLGCGECYYTKGLEEAMPSCRIGGVDISKIALMLGSKKLKSGETAVASVYNLPFKTECADAVTLLFSPYAEEEIKRVLKKNGDFFMVIPGRRHLFGLKKLLYDLPYENKVEDFSLEGFTFISETHLLYEKTFKNKDLKNLFTMTPYYYRTPKEGKMRADRAMELQTEVEFHLLHYKKAE